MNNLNQDRKNKVLKILKEKIKNKTAKVGIIGLGYVGLQLAVEKCKAGFTVTGIDMNIDKVEMLNRGRSYLKDISDEQIGSIIDDGTFNATADFEELRTVDVIVICVPTPLTVMREPDMSYIRSALNEITVRLQKGQLIILESTTYPGTTEEVLLPALQQPGLVVGEDFFLAYSPERVDPGNKVYQTHNTPRVVGGVTGACCEVARLFYEQTVCRVVPVSTPAAAEMTKLFENAYRAVNIGFVTELMLLCDKMKIDIWEVINAAGTKPFGIQIFYPGPGFGGHCIPVDPFYLSYRARKYGFYTNFIELAGQMNIQACSHVLEKIKKILNDNQKCLNGSKILVLGVAYKKDVEDIRESPALRVISGLMEEKASVSYHDPYVHKINLPFPGETLHSVPLCEEEIMKADCVVILTDHSCMDYEYVVKHARVIVDTRNAIRDVKCGREKIYKI